MDRTERPRVVVVGLDGRDDPQVVVDVAAAAASRRGVPLELYARAGVPVEPALYQACVTWAGLRVTARVITGDLPEVLIAASREAATVVVGSGGDPDRMASGWTAGQVAAHAYCPTVAVPSRTAGRCHGPVLVGVDVSGNDEPAVAFAFDEAARRGVPLTVAHVWSGVPFDELSPVDPYAHDQRTAQETVDRLLAEMLAGWVQNHPQVPVWRLPIHDVNRAKALLAASAGTSLTVLGSNRHPEFSDQLLGPVARQVLHQSECPVAIVRAATRTLDP